MGQRLPSFLVVGAAKCATTWLQRGLQACPGVFMPDPEPHHFSRRFDEGLDRYARWFEDAGDARILGEKSNSYLDHPEAAGRIVSTLPGVKLLAQLRDPVERAYSDYCMLYRRGEVDGAIERRLDPDRAAGNRFLEGGLYARHLARFDALFPPGDVELLLYEDVRREPEAVLARAAGFVGAAPGAAGVPGKGEGGKVKDKGKPLVPLAWRRRLAPFKRLARPYRGSPWFEAARSLIAKPVAYPVLPEGLRAELRAFYADDVAALERRLGRPTGWPGFGGGAIREGAVAAQGGAGPDASPCSGMAR